MDLSVNLCLGGLSTTALALHLYLKKQAPSSSTTSKSSASTSKSTSSSSSSAPSLPSPSSSLTRLYLPAHLLALFSDWLQGPYVFQVVGQTIFKTFLKIFATV